MSQQLIHGFSEQQLDALRISAEERTDCLKYLVPFKRCFLNRSFASFILNQNECQNQQRSYQMCLEPITLRRTGYGPILLKRNAVHKFNEEKIAPSLDQNYRPTILSTSFGH